MSWPKTIFSTVAPFAYILLLPLSVTAQISFTVNMDGAQADGGAGTGSAYTGSGTVTLNAAEDEITVSVTHNVPSGDILAGHIHEGAVGVGGPVVFPLSNSAQSPINDVFALSSAQVDTLKAEGYYINVHTNAFSQGEMRGQILAETTTGTLGDPNGDGSINSTDALWIIQSEFGLRDGLTTDTSDLNADGAINSTDALWCIQIEFGLRDAP